MARLEPVLFLRPVFGRGIEKGEGAKDLFFLLFKVAASSQCLRTTTTYALEASPQGLSAKARAEKRRKITATNMPLKDNRDARA